MTLAYDRVGTTIGAQQNIPAYITASANDNTTSVAGRAIPNTDGAIKFVSAQYINSAAGGTSPTVTLSLEGSNDGSTWSALNEDDGTAITTSALSISGTQSTYFDTVEQPRVNFPQFVRVKLALGGTSPTHNGVVSVSVTR